eukprot:5008365-Ditylum_brightwellii.AAC.1
MSRKVDPIWVLLDSQSMLNVFSNPALLVNIWHANSALGIYCTTGKTTTNLIGDLPGFGTIWYQPRRIVNIIFLAKVATSYQVMYGSLDSQGFVVHLHDG